ncbi:hypothetical protein EJF36_10160 [Bacillus sp. HMF5848]|uniref:hypothetical protein n=1 Tax=Bacillus sp. HMF5848 TaxID=2495421 RepID=UPI000F7A7C54|nr:hypothetical protein [Bacillus sp. HMF5848]RSK27214.1 hypothetical protein EJF36_10160 [Bacillus sp. HMF5848]
MSNNELEQHIIKSYQQDENMMILVFAQWCINNDLDPKIVYARAYPLQGENYALQQAIDLTVPQEESETIPDDTLLAVLSLYGNDDLAIIVTEEIIKRKKNQGER